MASVSAKATYADGSTTSGLLLVPAWWSRPYSTGGDLVFSSFLTESSMNWNRSNIFQTINWLDSSKELVSLTFPKTASGSCTSPGGDSVGTQLHVFALSMLPASNSWRLSMLAQPKSGWRVQTRSRSLKFWSTTSAPPLFYETTVFVFVLSPRVSRPCREGVIHRLGPGDQAKVEIGVRNRNGAAPGDSGPATIVIQGKNVASKKYTFQATYGIAPYKATYESIYTHESPSWFNNPKYGIFIH